MKKCLLFASFALVLLCCSCHKECHCYGYDGAHHYYSQDEVKSADKSCSEMKYQAGFRYYSLCEWDY